MQKRMLEYKNSEGPQELTNNFLTQKELIDDDFMLLKYDDGFERVLIFDRDAQPTEVIFNDSSDSDDGI